MSYRVLVVDDEVLISTILSNTLELEGYAVETALSAARALEILEKTSDIDLLLTDIRMPGAMDGQDLARRAREMRPEIAVIYTSGHYHGLRDIDAVPGARFVPKPFLPSEICVEVGRVRTSHAS